MAILWLQEHDTGHPLAQLQLHIPAILHIVKTRAVKMLHYLMALLHALIFNGLIL